jgi:hypothetical protein
MCLLGIARAGEPRSVTIIPGGPEPPSDVLAELGEYWVGVVCSQADATLRAQMTLPDKQGLVVEQVSPDSPAAKAGIQANDVLLKANDKPLEKVSDLIAVIKQVKDAKIAFQLVRAGKQQTIAVAPAKRPAGALPPGLTFELGKGEREQIEDLLKKALPGDQKTLRFQFLNPGMILPPGAPLPPGQKLPEDMSITITREGSKPAQITVKQGEEKWEGTEKDLAKAPEKFRPYVAQMLPYGRIGIQAFTVPVPPPGPEGVGRQLQDMNRQINEMRKAMEEMRKPPHKPVPREKADHPPEPEAEQF